MHRKTARLIKAKLSKKYRRSPSYFLMDLNGWLLISQTIKMHIWFIRYLENTTSKMSMVSLDSTTQLSCSDGSCKFQDTTRTGMLVSKRRVKTSCWLLSLAHRERCKWTRTPSRLAASTSCASTSSLDRKSWRQLWSRKSPGELTWAVCGKHTILAARQFHTHLAKRSISIELSTLRKLLKSVSLTAQRTSPLLDTAKCSSCTTRIK